MMQIKKISIIFFYIQAVFIFSQNQIKADFTQLKNINLEYQYYILQNNQKIESVLKIYPRQYAEKKIIIAEMRSQLSETKNYFNLDGTIFKTDIYDKVNKKNYQIRYTKYIRITIYDQNHKKEEILLEKNALDVSTFAIILATLPSEKINNKQINIFNYKNGEVKTLTIRLIDSQYPLKLENNIIYAKKYKIDAFFIFDTILYYGQNDFPVLLHYEGPHPDNFLEKLSYTIDIKSYQQAKQIYQQKKN